MSGSGKTTIARGLMALLSQQGYCVQPFKCGPDYIDTKFHAEVCGRPSINLDTFMASAEHVRALFQSYSADADICVVEGMMGLFDGYDREQGSTYDIARCLGLPVVLVVDARSAAYSTAALLQGFLHFRSDIRFAGIIFNKVGSPRHEQMLRQVCSDLQVACLGCMPKCPELEQASRYLGLDFSQSAEVSHLVQLLSQRINVSCLLTAVGDDKDTVGTENCGEVLNCEVAGPVLVARSAESFSFIYQETLDALGSVAFFNPEHDVPKLDNVQMLYLPGGYPEKHAETLAANEDCRRAIKDYAEHGGRIQAECGGMMYLCQSITTDNGEHPMCGVLPYRITARCADRRLSLGYRRFTLNGHEYRGHEFHYSQFLGTTPPSATQVYNATGEPVATPVIRYKNVLASYTHLYNVDYEAKENYSCGHRSRQ